MATKIEFTDLDFSGGTNVLLSGEQPTARHITEPTSYDAKCFMAMTDLEINHPHSFMGTTPYRIPAGSEFVAFRHWDFDLNHIVAEEDYGKIHGKYLIDKKNGNPVKLCLSPENMEITEVDAPKRSVSSLVKRGVLAAARYLKG